MGELLETERSYVKDLELAINCFLKPMRAAGSRDPSLPAALRGKEAIIFGNVEDILAFHKSTFLKELEKYETMPEDVGHCFVTWVREEDKCPMTESIDSQLLLFSDRLPSSTSMSSTAPICLNQRNSLLRTGALISKAYSDTIKWSTQSRPT